MGWGDGYLLCDDDGRMHLCCRVALKEIDCKNRYLHFTHTSVTGHVPEFNLDQKQTQNKNKRK